MPTPATNGDNDTRIGLFGCQRQEVVPIARDQHLTVFAGVLEHLNIGGPNRKNLPKFGHLIAFMPQHSGDFARDVMVEEEPHSSELIWRATKESISAR
jgi:hypothetical protein